MLNLPARQAGFDVAYTNERHGVKSVRFARSVDKRVEPNSTWHI